MVRFPSVLPLALLPLTAVAEVEEEIPWGIEVVTGLRSDYVYRGFDLGGTTLDAQVEAEIALTNDLLVIFGGWLASELSDDFSEGGGYAELRREFDEFSVGAGFTHAARDETIIGDTTEAYLFLQYFPTNFLDLKLLGSRDFESNGWYTSLEGGWSHRIAEDAFILLTSGFSWSDDFNDRDGWNDYFGRLSLTYAISDTVSITPYAGWSVLLRDHGGSDDSLFAGFWFEVNF